LFSLCFGAAASAFTMWFVDNLRRNSGTYIAPASTFTEMRVIVGTAALLAVASVFALAVGTILRRSASAVAAVIVLVVLPYILAVSSVGALQWLLRVTPAAGFAVQQTLHQYPQVDGAYVADFEAGRLTALTASGQILGTVVITGMLAATAIAIFIIPMLFVLMEQMASRFTWQAHDSGPAPAPLKGEA